MVYVYCICRKREKGFMIQCDACEDWYHGPCVNVKPSDAKELGEYFCPRCKGFQKRYNDLHERILDLEAKWSTLNCPTEAQILTEVSTCNSDQTRTDFENHQEEIARLSAKLMESEGQLKATLQAKDTETEKFTQEIATLHQRLLENQQMFATILQEKDAEVQILTQNANMLKQEAAELKSTLDLKEQELQQVTDVKEKLTQSIKKKSRLSLSYRRSEN